MTDNHTRATVPHPLEVIRELAEIIRNEAAIHTKEAARHVKGTEANLLANGRATRLDAIAGKAERYAAGEGSDQVAAPDIRRELADAEEAGDTDRVRECEEQLVDELIDGPAPDPEALAWLQGWVREDMARLGETQTRPTHDLTEEGDEFTRSVVLDAYVAGRAFAVGKLFGRMYEASVLIAEGAKLFRQYEADHLAKVERYSAEPRSADQEQRVDVARRRAQFNEQVARRFEAWINQGLNTIRSAQEAFVAANPGATLIDADAYRIDISRDDPPRPAPRGRPIEPGEVTDVFGYKTKAAPTAHDRFGYPEQPGVTRYPNDKEGTGQ